MGFTDFQLTASPPWFLRPKGAAWVTAMARAKAGLSRWAADAIAGRMPGQAPDDALIPLGAERVIESGVSESTAAWRERIRLAHAAWRKAGTRVGLTEVLSVSFPASFSIEAVGSGGYYGNGWSVEATRVNWPQFDLFFYANPLTVRTNGAASFKGGQFTDPTTINSITGYPLANYHLVIEIVTGGVIDSDSVTCRASINGGVTWGVEAPLLGGGPYAMDEVGAPGGSELQFNVTPGKTVVAGDRWTFFGELSGIVYALPDDNDGEITHIRRLLANWRPGFTRCGQIHVLLRGESWGWADAFVISDGSGYQDATIINTTGLPDTFPSSGTALVTDVSTQESYQSAFTVSGVDVTLATPVPSTMINALRLQVLGDSATWGDDGNWGDSLVAHYDP